MLGVDWKKTWDDATLEERVSVLKMYNKYYNKSGVALTMTEAYYAWSGRRWLTIYFTFGVKPAEGV